ncbi:hypothetical protein ES703_124294 [subsurface metagenome]
MSYLVELFEQGSIEWLWVMICPGLIGMAKAGLSALAMPVIPILAGIFDARLSTGILLPMLSIGDVFAVKYYHRHAKWRYILRLLPWAVLGIALGVVVGGLANNAQFRHILAVIILVGLLIMIIREFQSGASRISGRWWLSALIGVAVGFTSMVANAAGTLMAIYLLSKKLSKNSYIGTLVCFFMIVNLIQVPAHVFIWKTITLDTLLLDITLAPLILAGVFLGILVVKRIPEKPYRFLIIIMTSLAALRLLF